MNMLQPPCEFGNYTLLRKLGRGGMGSVYLARQRSLDRLVVLKTIAPGFDIEPHLFERFQREARAAAAVHHPGIVQIFESGLIDGVAFIAMEYVAGPSLVDLVRSRGRLPVTVALVVIRDTCIGLEYAHTHGVIHGDIKPSNLALTNDGVIKILDFGLARRGDESEVILAGATLGTPAYLPPEVATGGPRSTASDVFATGVLAFELLAGQRPFAGDSLRDLLDSVRTQDPVTVDDVNPQVPRGVATIVHRMLAKQPAERCTIEEARAAFDQAVRDLGIEDGPAHVREFLQDRTSMPTSVPPDAESMPRARAARSARSLPAPARWSVPWLAVASVVAGTGVSMVFMKLLPPWSLAVPIVLALAITFARLGRPPRPAHPGGAAARPPVTGTAYVGRASDAATRIDSRAATMTAPASPPGREPAEPQFDRQAMTIEIPFSSTESDADGSASNAAVVPPDSTQLIMLGDTGATPASPTAADAAASGKPHEATAAPTEAPPAAIVVTHGSGATVTGTRIAVTRIPFSIGRAAEADLSMELDPLVSRQHATIVYEHPHYWITDEASSNGTWIDGRAVVGRASLPFGCSVRIGACTFTLVDERPDDIPDLTGQVFHERFELVQFVRRTARTLVYDAVDRRSPRPAVIKILSPRAASTPESVADFRRDAATVALLSHPHIARMLDAGSVELDLRTGARVVLEYHCHERFEGGSLDDRVGARNWPALDQAVTWITDLASAAAYAHRRGVVHGGIKPSAIVLDGEDHVYLADFAYAVAMGETPGRLLYGAPAYLAPEQWDGLALDARADEYSLAVVAYLLVTGSLPYAGQEDPDVRGRNFARGPFAAHLEAQRNGRPEVPVAMSAVLQRALSTRPDDRYPTLDAFALELAGARTGGPSGATPTVFISYRRDESAGWANLIAMGLRQAHGIESFVDVQQVDSAGPFPVRIRRAIERSDVFVCLMSSRTLESTYVCEEIAFAHQCGKPMIPVLQESFRPATHHDVDRPPVRALLEQDGVHLFDVRNVHVEHSIQDLARLVIRTANAKRGTP